MDSQKWAFLIVQQIHFWLFFLSFIFYLYKFPVHYIFVAEYTDDQEN
jgi:hypothetical protein